MTRVTDTSTTFDSFRIPFGTYRKLAFCFVLCALERMYLCNVVI
jgi:hypothetical protein